MDNPYILRHRVKTNKAYVEYRHYPENSLWHSLDNLTIFRETCEQLEIKVKEFDNFIIESRFITSDLSEEQLTLFQLMNSELIYYGHYQTDLKEQQAKDDSSFGILDPILDLLSSKSPVANIIILTIAGILIIMSWLSIAGYIADPILKWLVISITITNWILHFLTYSRNEKFQRLMKHYNELS